MVHVTYTFIRKLTQKGQLRNKNCYKLVQVVDTKILFCTQFMISI
jgi:capsid portal protein